MKKCIMWIVLKNQLPIFPKIIYKFNTILVNIDTVIWRLTWKSKGPQVIKTLKVDESSMIHSYCSIY